MPAVVHLNERAEQVLHSLISRYVSDGAPVGSHTLAREGGLDLSPATIRNVMAGLEAHGLVEAPHTSAGRIPTQRGYRVFVSGLLGAGSPGGMRAAIDKLNKRARGQIEERILDAPDPKSILTRATEMLSQITSFAGVVSIPAARHAHIRQVEFLRLSQRRVLAILITEDGQVQNRILTAELEYTESELRDAANVFNENYSSRTLRGVRAELLAHMRRERRSMHREMRTAISIARQLFEDDMEAGESVLVSGENNLLSVPDFGELERLKQLFDTFKTKQVLFDLLQKSMFADGVNIFIGEESGYRMLRDCSIIAAPYEIDRRKVGVLGVIGPTRMQYDEVITAVDITAKLLSSALSADARRH
ncbi:MAG: heat-inducible transcriptional repressor HrcA [Gammaproteobacteria bacterium]